jgi:hypothetical protein
MKRLDLPEPEFIQSEIDHSKVQVILRNNIAYRKRWIDSDVAAAVGANITKSLNENQKIVLNYVVVHGSVNASQTARLTGHNWHTSKKLLMGLTELGILDYDRREDVEVDRKATFRLAGKGTGT